MGAFFISIVLFLITPHFFDYKKKLGIIELFLLKNYGFKIQKAENIKYKAFPTPHLELSTVRANFNTKDLNLTIQKLKIYPELVSIYNYENFKLKKIKLKNIKLVTDLSNLENLAEGLLKLKKKIFISNFDFIIKDKSKNIIKFKNILFSNYGYKKNKITGEVFNKKFKLNFNNNFKNIYFKLLDTGISAKLNVYKKKDTALSGILKGKVLNSNFALDFTFIDNNIRINNLLFRDKNLSFDSKGFLNIKPYFYTDLNTKIKSINPELISNFKINNLTKFKNLIKKLNSKNEIFLNQAD